MAYPVGEKAGLDNYLEDFNRPRQHRDLESELQNQEAAVRDMLQNVPPPRFFNSNFEQRLSSPDDLDPRQKQKTEEDSRLDFLLRMQKTMNETFDNPAYVNPHGMTCFDYKSIPEQEKKILETFKMKTRRENHMYFRNHPELDALMAVFIQRILKIQPKDPIKFTAEFFAQKRLNQEELIVLVEEEKEKIRRHRHVSPWQHAGVGFSNKGFQEVNEVKELSVGILADKFEFTPPPSPIQVDIKPRKKFYCGCKDPSRRATSHRPKLVSLLPQPISEFLGEIDEEEWEGLENNYFGPDEEEEDDSVAGEAGYEGDPSNEEAVTDAEEENGVTAAPVK